jgi:hypothetical protein
VAAIRKTRRKSTGIALQSETMTNAFVMATGSVRILTKAPEASDFRHARMTAIIASFLILAT